MTTTARIWRVLDRHGGYIRHRNGLVAMTKTEARRTYDACLVRGQACELVRMVKTYGKVTV